MWPRRNMTICWYIITLTATTSVNVEHCNIMTSKDCVFRIPKIGLNFYICGRSSHTIMHALITRLSVRKQNEAACYWNFQRISCHFTVAWNSYQKNLGKNATMKDERLNWFTYTAKREMWAPSIVDIAELERYGHMFSSFPRTYCIDIRQQAGLHATRQREVEVGLRRRPLVNTTSGLEAIVCMLYQSKFTDMRIRRHIGSSADRRRRLP